MLLPKEMEKCPIVDALLEIRFSSKINLNAVFGVLYNTLQSDYPKVNPLPILQLPDNVRANDPSLKYKPYYKVSNENFVLQIGPDVFTISSYPKYKGWTEFSKVIFGTLDKIKTTDVVDSIQRVGIRYINFFENDIFDNIDLKVSVHGDDIDYNNTVVRTDIKHKKDSFTSTLQISNNVTIKEHKGSIIDIDTSTNQSLQNFFNRKEDIIKSGHLREKELFFNLLKADFLKTFNPKY